MERPGLLQKGIFISALKFLTPTDGRSRRKKKNRPKEEEGEERGGKRFQLEPPWPITLKITLAPADAKRQEKREEKGGRGRPTNLAT